MMLRRLQPLKLLNRRWRSTAAASAQTPLVRALEKEPCLQCGKTPAFERVLCKVSALPLTCSTECASELVLKHPSVVDKYRDMHENAQYATSADARELFSKVLLPRNRAVNAETVMVDSWESYLQQYTKDKRWLQDDQALRLVSAAYSYIMTLAYYLPDLLRSTSDTTDIIKLQLLGARAEATMPRHIWEDLCYFYPHSRFVITLIGDHAPQMRKKAEAPGANNSNSALEMDIVNGLYHEIPDKTLPDAFVMFNPGVGHPFLKSNWRPTIEAVLKSGRPILITAFSQEDQERDLEVLSAIATESQMELGFIVSPCLNPFQKRTCQMDPSNLLAPIQTNNRIMIVQLVKEQ